MRPPFAAPLLRDAVLVAGIAGVLAFPFVGLLLTTQGTAPTLSTRFPEFAGAVVLIFFGRLGISAARRGHSLFPIVLGVAMATVGAFSLLFETAGMAADSAAPWHAFVPGTFLATVASAGGVAIAVVAGRNYLLGDSEPVARKPLPMKQLLLWTGVALAGIAIVLPLLPAVDRRLIDVATLVLTYVMLGWGLNIVVGLAGLLDLGYVAFYAVGAYSYALLSVTFGWSFWVCLPLAGTLAALFGILLGFPVLRLRGDYLAIVTLGFGEMIRIILLNWYDFTNGPDGISNIGRPSFFGFQFTSKPVEGTESFHTLFDIAYDPVHRLIFLYYLILALALLTNAFTLRIRRLPVGRAWEALREDEIACRSLGVNPRNTKLSAFAIGAMFAGFAGSFFATRQGFVSPESFTFIESAILVAIVVLGGMGSQIGVAVAAIILVGLPEYFRELQEYRMLAFGMGMVLIMLWRPGGLLTHREPTIRTRPQPASP
ncbi:MAG: high-affinity branched-chain amino acid ABC transporter permease LivM [Rhodospirillales bacterium]|nr:high-affinity branched-chain amino acid ABC transporter permease LivM [Rhodospirillales bacterium]